MTRKNQAAMNAPAPHRYLGFDLLRGMCALTVAIYHLCIFEGIGDFHLLGSYSVYLFFVLSGASMVVAYRDKFAKGMRYTTFIGRRFFRLAPLYWLVVFARGHFSGQWGIIALNLTFLFGFANPAEIARTIGAWSLGIEFIFYFLFPVFLALGALRTRKLATALMAAIALQLLYIGSVIRAEGDLTTQVASYTQFPSFIAYFLGGCAIGHWLLDYPNAFKKDRLIWPAFIVLFSILLFFSAASTDLALNGVRGFGFIVLCLIIVWLSGMLSVSRRLAPIATAFGNFSYGLYLLHPLFYMQITKHTHVLQQLGTPLFNILLLGGVIAVALAIERFIERPIKRFGYRWLGQHSH